LSLVISRLALATDSEKKEFCTGLCSSNTALIKLVEVKPKPVPFTAIMSEAKANPNEWVKVGSKRTQVVAKAASVPSKQPKWSELSASKAKKLCPKQPKMEPSADFQSVFLKGFFLQPGTPIRMLRSCLQEECGFDSSSIWHLSYRGKGITQLAMVTSAIPDLVAALRGNKLGFILAEKYNPRLPDEFESSAQALERFHYRMDRDINCLKVQLTKVFNYTTVMKMRGMLRYLEAYKICNGLEPILEPAVISYVDSAFDSNDAWNSLGSVQC
jgi:hypothetical protein